MCQSPKHYMTKTVCLFLDRFCQFRMLISMNHTPPGRYRVYQLLIFCIKMYTLCLQNLCLFFGIGNLDCYFFVRFISNHLCFRVSLCLVSRCNIISFRNHSFIYSFLIIIRQIQLLGFKFEKFDSILIHVCSYCLHNHIRQFSVTTCDHLIL